MAISPDVGPAGPSSHEAHEARASHEAHEAHEARSAARRRAERRLRAVRDRPRARLELLRDLYRSIAGEERYGHGELAFMAWEVERGVLAPPSAATPGSAWWRAVNERLLVDALEACFLARAGLADGASNPAAARWLDFVRSPSPASWYRAHNTSVALGYLEHADLARDEHRGEHELMNVTLTRVLFAQSMVERGDGVPGRLGPLGRLLADPRSDGIGLVVHVPELYPRHYPLSDRDRHCLEHRLLTPGGVLVALLDRDVVDRHLPALYEFAAASLAVPALAGLLRDGVPAYPSTVPTGGPGGPA